MGAGSNAKHDLPNVALRDERYARTRHSGSDDMLQGRAAAGSFQGEKIIPEEFRHFQVWTRCARKEERDWWELGEKKRDEVL